MEQTSGRDFNFDWDKYRYPKSIVSVKKQTCLERSVLQCTTKEKDFFCEKILLEIQALLDSGRVSNLNQIAFLFRSVKNDSVKELAEYLDHHGIPVYSPRSNMFFERTEVMLIIGTLIFMFPQYMETIKNGEQKNDSINYYKKCLLVAKNELSKNENAETMEWMRFRIRDHLTLANNFNYAFSGLVYQLLEHPPFSKFLDVSLDNGVHDTRTTRNVGLLIKLLVKFEYLNGISVLTKSNLEKNLKKLFNQYFRFLLDGGISEYEDESEYAPSGCVSFMTIHQSKGLEFPIVFVGSQSSVPRKQYNEEIETIIDRYSERGSFEELEMMKMFDFWRLFYVAFSRAQSLLIMIADFSKQNEPSKYFEYMYEDLPFETNFSKFDFESIKNSNLKNSYSFTTDIDSYMICPTQYKYFKELGFEEVRIGSTLFGTIVHETIEDVHKAIIRGEKETVTAENINKWFEINYKTGSKLNNYYLSKANLDSALSQVTSYVERMMPRWETISNAEMPVSLSQKKYIITGKVDLITNNRGQYEILDFKTEKKPQINIETEKVERVRRQLEVYAYLVEKRYNIKISGMKVYYTSEKDSNPYLSFQRNDEHIKETIKTFDSVVNKIEKKEFSRLCSDLKICKNCDLRFFCKRR
jgi:DNA helicase-2/ATP-dependent DNA helicase PcrA